MERVYFHGTRQAYKADILKTGLRPEAAQGNDAITDNRHHEEGSKLGPAVYLAEQEELAALFAINLSEQTSDAPCVFQVTLPETEIAKLQFDDDMGTNPFIANDAFWNAWRYPGDILPEWLSEVTP